MFPRLTILAMALLLAGCSLRPVQVLTPDGLLEGYVDDGVEHYLGIPYARPPVGELRWRPPQSAEPWQGVLRVVENPTACAQFIPLWRDLVGSEDCLYLNIWAPADRPPGPLPVMVWLHGGGFFLGKGSFGNDDWAALAELNKVVVVSVDYRLGVFGFMAHPALTAEDPAHPSSGNYGIEDQAAALRWVRGNIAAFGGDPDRVTVFGQSAGAISVCAQLASPPARGLFQGAIIQSGTCATPLPTLASASELGERVAAGVGCDGATDVPACMRNKSAQEVADVLPPDPTFDFSEASILWWPNVDGLVLPHQMMEAYRSGDFNRVPVIAGVTRRGHHAALDVTQSLAAPAARRAVPATPGIPDGSRELAEAVAARYPLADYPTPFDALTAAFSDGFFICQTRWLVQALGAHVPTWFYRFDYDRAPFPLPWADLKAYHGAEIQFVFDHPLRLVGPASPRRRSGWRSA